MFNRMLNITIRTRTLLTVLVSVWIMQACGSGQQQVLEMGNAPYPPSQHIKQVIWDHSSILQAAPGSDLWPITWGRGGEQYTAWGDGGGFGGSNDVGRVTLGVAVIYGSPDSLEAINLFGGKNSASKAVFGGKPTGLLSVDGDLFMGVVEQGKWFRLKLGRSNDKGKTWLFNSNEWEKDAGWDFAELDGAFSDLAFLQYGQNLAESKDEYIYMYSQDKRAHKQTYDIAMIRVHKEKIMDRNAYEYFSGLGKNGPSWTKRIEQRQPIFSDSNSVGWGSRITYNSGLDRYLLTTWHNKSSGWGIFDAAQPWGPWTTVAYYRLWLDDIFKFGFSFPAKWVSDDGTKFYMIFSGIEKWDSWNTIEGKFILHH